MKRLFGQIKQAFYALSAGDTERFSRDAMHKTLFPERISTPVPDRTSTRKLIALGVGESLSVEALRFALAACRRRKADLLFISCNPMQVRDLIQPYLSQIGSVLCETEEVPNSSRRAVLGVLRRRSGVLFSITGTPDDPVRTLVCSRPGLFERKFSLPVVLMGKESHPSLLNPQHAEHLAVPRHF